MGRNKVRPRDTQMDRKTDGQKDRKTAKPKDHQTERWTGKQTIENGQEDRKTDR